MARTRRRPRRGLLRTLSSLFWALLSIITTLFILWLVYSVAEVCVHNLITLTSEQTHEYSSFNMFLLMLS